MPSSSSTTVSRLLSAEIYLDDVLGLVGKTIGNDIGKELIQGKVDFKQRSPDSPSASPTLSSFSQRVESSARLFLSSNAKEVLSVTCLAPSFSSALLIVTGGSPQLRQALAAIAGQLLQETLFPAIDSANHGFEDPWHLPWKLLESLGEFLGRARDRPCPPALAANKDAGFRSEE
jgi:hypothetical protein